MSLIVKFQLPVFTFTTVTLIIVPITTAKSKIAKAAIKYSVNEIQ